MATMVSEIQKAICSQISLSQADDGETIQVDLPFVFDDGDQCYVQLAQANGGFIIEDAGETLFKTGYSNTDILGPGHSERLKKLLRFYGIDQQDGVLTATADSTNELGSRVFTLLQVILEVMNLSKLPAASKPAKRDFARKFSTAIRSAIPEHSLEAKWTDETKDPNRLYLADYSVKRDSDRWLLFGVHTNPKCLQSSVVSQHHKYESDKIHSFAAVDSRVADKYVELLRDISDTVMYLDREQDAIQEFLQSEVAA